MKMFGLLCAGSIVVLLAGCAGAWAQKPDKSSGYDLAARATVLHDANVYVAADAGSQQLSTVLPGHEVVVVERSSPWVKVFANTDVQEDPEDKPEFGDENAPTPASGWIHDKGVVGSTTPSGDVILYGAAANLEDLATRPNAPKNAASEAHLLYRRVAEYFPQSSLAPEAAWRSADIRWQLEKRQRKRHAAGEPAATGRSPREACARCGRSLPPCSNRTTIATLWGSGRKAPAHLLSHAISRFPRFRS